MENWQTEPEPDPEDQYVEQAMKQDVAAHFVAREPRLVTHIKVNGEWVPKQQIIDFWNGN